MVENPIFISYHTGNPYYSSCAESLVSRIRSLGGEIIMERLDDSGYYWKNTLKKPSFIFSKLQNLKRDLIWIDADTDLLSYTDCMKSWESDIFFASHTGDLQGIKASPMGIKYNARSISFFENLSSACNSKIDSNEIDLDHDVMKYEILPEFTDRLSIEILSCNGTAVDYTDGKYIRNGISRGFNKARETKIVMDKNIKRDIGFRSLSLNNFHV
jgi:hypothetical protein